jgi:hypothetical protein
MRCLKCDHIMSLTTLAIEYIKLLITLAIVYKKWLTRYLNLPDLICLLYYNAMGDTLADVPNVYKQVGFAYLAPIQKLNSV